MNNEPVLTIAGIAAAVGAVLTALTAFGVDLTPDQRAAILGVWATVGPLLFAVWTRRKVTPS